jgi:hypothetical protein
LADKTGQLKKGQLKKGQIKAVAGKTQLSAPTETV